MKNLMFLGLLLALGLQAASAQHVLKGRVTDMDGNPIAGAKVENAGGSEQVTTDMNGRFSLETAGDVSRVNVYYTGMQKASKKARQDMVVKMGETNWWNERPSKWKWLIGVETAIPDMDDINPAFGLTVGMVKQYGWYVKGLFSSTQSTDGTCTGVSSDPVMTGETKGGYMSVVGGGIMRLGCPFHLYAGLGYVDRKVAWEAASGSWYEYEGDSYSGLALDLGLMFRVKAFFLNAGIQTCLNSLDGLVGNFGIGVCF